MIPKHTCYSYAFLVSASLMAPSGARAILKWDGCPDMAATEFKATLGEPNRDNAKIVRYPLTVEVPANATPVSRAADGAYALVHLTTTHPDVKELTIKVRYIVKE